LCISEIKKKNKLKQLNKGKNKTFGRKLDNPYRNIKKYIQQIKICNAFRIGKTDLLFFIWSTKTAIYFSKMVKI